MNIIQCLIVHISWLTYLGYFPGTNPMGFSPFACWDIILSSSPTWTVFKHHLEEFNSCPRILLSLWFYSHFIPALGTSLEIKQFRGAPFQLTHYDPLAEVRLLSYSLHSNGIKEMSEWITGREIFSEFLWCFCSCVCTGENGWTEKMYFLLRI